MTYPTPPGARISYDTDGTIGFVYDNARGVHNAPLSSDFLKAANSDGPNVGFINAEFWSAYPLNYVHLTPVDAVIAFRFPVAMHLSAVATMFYRGLAGVHNPYQFVIETSSDSSNGLDGTWDDLATYTTGYDFSVVSYNAGSWDPSLNPFYDIYQVSGAAVTGSFSPIPQAFPQRRMANDVSGVGWRPVYGDASRQVMWLRLRVTGIIANTTNTSATNPWSYLKLHLYGEPDTTADTQRLQFVDSAGVYKPFFDFGDISKVDTVSQVFRIKNMHSSLTAESVVLSIQASNPTMAVPSPDTWCKVSLDGTLWGSSVSLGDIDPSDVSDLVTLRVMAEPGILGPWSPRIQVIATGGWS